MTKALMKSLARKRGYEIIRLRFGRHLLDDLEVLLSGIDNPVIFDVGANVGQTSLQYISKFPAARVYAFEPNPVAFNEMRQSVSGHPQVTVYNLALGRAEGSAPLNLMENSVGSSLLDIDPGAPSYDWTIKKGTVEVPTQTVDSVCDEYQINEINLLKIDTQGSELAVVEGAVGALLSRRIKLVLLEVNFVPLYKGQPSFSVLNDRLNTLGYQLVDFYNKYRNQNRQLAWCDALFALSSRSEEFSWA